MKTNYSVLKFRSTKAASILLAIISVLALGGASVPAQTLVSTPAWQNTSVGSTIDRDMAYNPATGNLLLVQNTPAILRLKPSNGTSPRPNLNTSLLSPGTFFLPTLP